MKDNFTAIQHHCLSLTPWFWSHWRWFIRSYLTSKATNVAHNSAKHNTANFSTFVPLIQDDGHEGDCHIENQRRNEKMMVNVTPVRGAVMRPPRNAEASTAMPDKM